MIQNQVHVTPNILLPGWNDGPELLEVFSFEYNNLFEHWIFQKKTDKVKSCFFKMVSILILFCHIEAKEN